jgi:hypothetical protein
VKQYIERVGDSLQPLVKRPLRGFPVVMPMLITVKDAEGTEARLPHDMLIELPADKIQELLESRLSDSGRRPRSPLDQLGIRNPSQQNAFIVPEPDLPLVWNDGTPIEVAHQLRQLWPKVELVDPQSSLERLAASCAIVESERQINPVRNRGEIQSLPVKTWRTLDGKEILGRLAGASARGISIHAEGEYHSSDLAFDVADQTSLDNAWIALQGLRIVPEFSKRPAGPARIQTREKTHPIGNAIQQFRSHYGCLPPRAIVDETGRPLLSWRVLLLPYLGHSRLFHLFRLEEPWDSEHNRKLIPYMPLVYNATQAGLPLGKTTLKALTGPDDAPFPDKVLRRFYDFEKDPAYALLMVEVDKKDSVEWTKPEDLQVTKDRAWLSRLYITDVDGQKYLRGIYGDGIYRQAPVAGEEG